jgi:hypothetical protein
MADESVVEDMRALGVRLLSSRTSVRVISDTEKWTAAGGQRAGSQSRHLAVGGRCPGGSSEGTPSVAGPRSAHSVTQE